MAKRCIVPLGFNEADTFKSSSMLIYLNTEQEDIYTQKLSWGPGKLKRGWGNGKLIEKLIIQIFWLSPEGVG